MNWHKPPFNEDYEKLYGILDCKNKKVLDLGADYGSTAYYFLQKGAKHIIAVEGNPHLFKLLRENTILETRVTAIPLFITSPKHITALIETYKPDITKSDIEGWEWTIAEANPQTLKKCKEYLIETHTNQIYEQLKTTFKKINCELTHEHHYTEYAQQTRICLWKTLY